VKGFSFKQRLRRRRTSDAELPVNAYYEAVSERYGIAQVILYSLLLAFVVLSFLGNTGMITYQNLYYFVKDLNASAETVDVFKNDSLSYPTGVSQSFTLYRKGLAVAGNDSVTVFTAGGRQTVSKSILYRNPTAVGSGKYLLVYDLGGNEYSLYNSYTRIHSGKTEAPIRSATMSDSGMYAIVTQTERNPSVVELFNSDFELINRYPYNGYVSEVAIHPKGSYLAVPVSEHRRGALETWVRVYRPGEGELFSEVKLGSSLGYRCGFTDAGSVAVFCGDGIYYTSVRGKLEEQLLFEGDQPVAFDMNGDGCVVVLKKNKNSFKKSVILFDKSGKVLYNSIVDETVEAAVLCDGVAFLKTPNAILRADPSDLELSRLPCVTEQRTMLALDRDRVLLCSAKQAVFHTFTR